MHDIKDVLQSFSNRAHEDYNSLHLEHNNSLVYDIMQRAPLLTCMTQPHHLALTTTPTAIFSPPSGRSNGLRGGGGGTGVWGLPTCLSRQQYTGPPSDSLPLYDNFTSCCSTVSSMNVAMSWQDFSAHSSKNVSFS
jgi:hypothetical protein